jgi:hypothetical protein
MGKEYADPEEVCDEEPGRSRSSSMILLFDRGGCKREGVAVAASTAG